MLRLALQTGLQITPRLPTGAQHSCLRCFIVHCFPQTCCRLSAFISELGRKSPARDAAFSFDFNKETNRELTAKVATSARVPPVRPVPNNSKVLGDFGSVASALEAHRSDTADVNGDGAAPKKKEEVTMRMAKARQVDLSSAAAAASDSAANKSIAADAARSHAK